MFLLEVIFQYPTLIRAIFPLLTEWTNIFERVIQAQYNFILDSNKVFKLIS